MTITEFLLARLTEDEQIAQAAGTGRQARWAYEPYTRTSERGAKYANGEVYMPDTEREVRCSHGGPPSCEVNLVTCDSEGQSPAVDPEQGHHIARHDPARVLVDVAAKRALVDYWSRAFQNPIDADKFPGHDWDLVRGAARWTLRHLATPYARHPDYQAYWAL